MHYFTKKSGQSINMIGGNQVAIMQPVTPQRTTETVALQPRPMYHMQPSPTGAGASSIASDK